jgi:hypothetical protein
VALPLSLFDFHVLQASPAHPGSDFRLQGGARQVHPGSQRVLSETPSPFGSPKHVQGVVFQGLVPQAVRSAEPCPSKLSTCPQEIKRACPLHPTPTDNHPAKGHEESALSSEQSVLFILLECALFVITLSDSSRLARQRQSRLVPDSHLLDRVL